MKKSIKFLSLTLVLILTFSTLLLTSCKKTGSSNENDGSNPYIIKTEVKDGCIWVTYSNDPENPVNIGALGADGSTGAEDSLNYYPLPDNTYGITAGNAKYLETIVIPETYNGKPVTAILDNAFNGATNLQKITIPSSIKLVGENAFENCGKLKFNELNGALYLGNDTNPFLVLIEAKETNITECVIDQNTIAICNDAFYNCANLSVLTIPKNVTSIGSRAFYGCSRIASLTLSEGPTFIGAETFRDCSSLQEISIPASVTTISTSAFAGCKSLTSVTFAKDSSLTSIGNSAFSNCTKLKSITIPKSVVNIGDHKANKNTDGTFSGCNNLTSVTIDKDSSLTQIGNYAFDACTKLESFDFPNSLKRLGISAFRSCGALKSVTLPDTLTSISQEAFWGCKNLTTLTLGKNTKSIGNKAFAGCVKLNNVTIPATANYIGTDAFFECNDLKNITVEDAEKWYAVKGSEIIEIKTIGDFSSPSTAADYLTTTYNDYSFQKTK